MNKPSSSSSAAAFAQFQRIFSADNNNNNNKNKTSKKRKRLSSSSSATLQRIQSIIAKEEKRNNSKKSKKNRRRQARTDHADQDDNNDNNNSDRKNSKVSNQNDQQIVDPYAEFEFESESHRWNFKQFPQNVYFVDNEFERPLQSEREIEEDTDAYTADTTAAATSVNQFDIFRSSIDFARKKDDVWFNHLHKRRTADDLVLMVGEYLSRHVDTETDGADDGQPTKNAFQLLQDDHGESLLQGLGERVYSDSPEMASSFRSVSDDMMTELLAERDLVHVWHEYLRDDLEEEAMEQQSKRSGDEEEKTAQEAIGSFRDAMQRDMFNVINDYRDLFMPLRSPENERSIIEGYVLHIANHLLKSKRYEWFNENKRKLRPDYKVKDGGFHPCRVLVLVPFRNTAFKIVQLLSVLLPKLRNVRRQEAFELTFSELTEEKERLLKTRPRWWRYIFDGCSDDNFVLGLKLNNGQLEIMCKMSEADIIIATPLGIKMEHEEDDGASDSDHGDSDDDSDNETDDEEKKDRNSDGEDYSKILSSVELCIVDQCDVIFMQNWEHLVTTFEIMNNMPTSMKDVDFARVRDYFIHGYAANFRQTIMISGHANPVINGLFNNIDFCCNIRGKVRVRDSYPGVLAGANPRQLPVTVPQVFERLECDSLDTVEDVRFRYFTEEVYGRFKRSSDGVFLIIVPNYVDFVRVRNFLAQENLPFLAISENQSNHVKALRRFSERQGTFLLYTERHFYYFAPRVQLFKVNQIVFYTLPEHTFTYTSMLAKAQMVYNEGYRNVRVMSLFSVFDALSLERIAGSEQCRQLLQSPQSVHVIENQEEEESDDDHDYDMESIDR